MVHPHGISGKIKAHTEVIFDNDNDFKNLLIRKIRENSQYLYFTQVHERLPLKNHKIPNRLEVTMAKSSFS